MPETKEQGGVDLSEVWNIVTDVATLVDADVSVDMGQRAFVVPKGLTPSDLDWTDNWERHIWLPMRRGNKCSDEYLDLWLFEISVDCDPTVVRIGVVWNAGGRYQGRGRYIHNAYMYGVVDSNAFGESVTVKGEFGDPVVVANNVAYLPGTISIHTEQFGINEAVYRYDFWIQGDGAGNIVRR